MIAFPAVALVLALAEPSPLPAQPVPEAAPLDVVAPAEEVEAPAPSAPSTEKPAAVDVHKPPAPWTWNIGGIPALAFDQDNGIVFGAVGSVYFHDGVTNPYRLAVSAQIIFSSKLVQDHYLGFDFLNVADLPLRLTARLGWSQSLSQNYCGVGMAVTCDPVVAEAAADDAGLKGIERDDFLRHYYAIRFMNPYATLQGRWALNPLPRRVEIFGGWRGSAYIPGTWADDDKDGEADLSPYPGSFYADDFPQGEPGFASVLQAGIMYDTRDNEPSPRRGVWAETSVRGAAPFWGSTWTWGGANATVRTFVPLLDGEAPLRLTLASRVVVDAVVGDPPIQEIVRPGGFIDYLSFGGSEMGRGIRVQRYVGKLKLYAQNELRWRFVEWEMFGQKFAASTNAFVDAGVVGEEILDPKLAGQPPVGFGGALLLHWAENFMLRIDIATSAVENFGTSVYINIGQTF